MFSSPTLSGPVLNAPGATFRSALAHTLISSFSVSLAFFKEKKFISLNGGKLLYSIMWLHHIDRNRPERRASLSCSPPHAVTGVPIWVHRAANPSSVCFRVASHMFKSYRPIVPSYLSCHCVHGPLATPASPAAPHLGSPVPSL